MSQIKEKARDHRESEKIEKIINLKIINKY